MLRSLLNDKSNPYVLILFVLGADVRGFRPETYRLRCDNQAFVLRKAGHHLSAVVHDIRCGEVKLNRLSGALEVRSENLEGDRQSCITCDLKVCSIILIQLPAIRDEVEIREGTGDIVITPCIRSGLTV